MFMMTINNKKIKKKTYRGECLSLCCGPVFSAARGDVPPMQGVLFLPPAIKIS